MITTRQSGGDAARAKTCGTDDLAPSIRAPSSRAWHGREQDGTRPHNVYTLCRVRRASVTHGYVAPTSLPFKAFLYDSRQDQWNQRPRWCPPPLPPPPPALLHLSLSLSVSLSLSISPSPHLSVSLSLSISPSPHLSREGWRQAAILERDRLRPPETIPTPSQCKHWSQIGSSNPVPTSQPSKQSGKPAYLPVCCLLGQVAWTSI